MDIDRGQRGAGEAADRAVVIADDGNVAARVKTARSQGIQDSQSRLVVVREDGRWGLRRVKSAGGWAMASVRSACGVGLQPGQWVGGTGAAIPRSRSQARFAFDGYPLSASTRSGRVRGLPFPSRGTRMSSSTAGIIVVSLMFPPVILIPSGLPRPSQTRCSLVVSPPRERPIP